LVQDDSTNLEASGSPEWHVTRERRVKSSSVSFPWRTEIYPLWNVMKFWNSKCVGVFFIICFREAGLMPALLLFVLNLIW